MLVYLFMPNNVAIDLSHGFSAGRAAVVECGHLRVLASWRFRWPSLRMWLPASCCISIAAGTTGGDIDLALRRGFGQSGVDSGCTSSAQPCGGAA